MQKIINKTYTDDQGESFDHLRNKHGQFNLKDVAAYLEKSASGLVKTLNKLASKGYNNPEYLDNSGRIKDSNYYSDKDASAFAGKVNGIGVSAANRPAHEVLQRSAPQFQQSVVNDEDKQGSDKTVYPQQKIASEQRYKEHPMVRKQREQEKRALSDPTVQKIQKRIKEYEDRSKRDGLTDKEWGDYEKSHNELGKLISKYFKK